MPARMNSLCPARRLRPTLTTTSAYFCMDWANSFLFIMTSWRVIRVYSLSIAIFMPKYNQSCPNKNSPAVSVGEFCVKLDFELQVERPLPGTHEGLARTVFLDAVDVHLRRANHKIHVVDAGVAARRVELFIGQLFAARQREAIGAPNGDMTGCILVKKRVVEEMSPPGDGGAGGDEGNFAQVGGAFIRIDQLLQDRLVLFRAHLDNFPLLKCDREIFDQTAAIAEWERGMDSS